MDKNEVERIVVLSNTGIKVANNQILIRKVTVIFLLFSGIWIRCGRERLSSIYRGELDFTTGSETALLSFVYQIGVQGAIALICVLYFMSKEVLEKVQKNSQFKKCITLLMITLGGFVGM